MNDAQLAHIATWDGAYDEVYFAGVQSIPAHAAPKPRVVGGGLRSVDASSLLAEPEPAVTWLVEGLFPAAGVVVLAGDPKSVKTLLALQLALTVGYIGDKPDFTEVERPFLGRRCGAGGALFVEEEGSRHKLRERIRMMSAGLGWEPRFGIEFVLHEGVRLDDKASLTSL